MRINNPFSFHSPEYILLKAKTEAIDIRSNDLFNDVSGTLKDNNNQLKSTINKLIQLKYPDWVVNYIGVPYKVKDLELGIEYSAAACLVRPFEIHMMTSDRIIDMKMKLVDYSSMSENTPFKEIDKKRLEFSFELTDSSLTADTHQEFLIKNVFNLMDDIINRDIDVFSEFGDFFMRQRKACALYNNALSDLFNQQDKDLEQLELYDLSDKVKFFLSCNRGKHVLPTTEQYEVYEDIKVFAKSIQIKSIHDDKRLVNVEMEVVDLVPGSEPTFRLKEFKDVEVSRLFNCDLNDPRIINLLGNES